MERTLSVNYPVLRQNKGVSLNTFVKNTVIIFLSVHYIYQSLLASRIDVQCCIFNLERGVFRTYFIIHPYFALVQGSSHLVSSPSILYPP